MVTQIDLVNHVGHNEICGKGEAVGREGRRLEGESGHCPFIHLVKLSKQFKLMKKKVLAKLQCISVWFQTIQHVMLT